MLKSTAISSSSRTTTALQSQLLNLRKPDTLLDVKKLLVQADAMTVLEKVLLRQKIQLLLAAEEGKLEKRGVSLPSSPFMALTDAGTGSYYSLLLIKTYFPPTK